MSIGYDKIKITCFNIGSINTSILNANNIEYVTTDSIQGIKTFDTATNSYIYIKSLRLKQNIKGNVIDFIIKKNQHGYHEASLYANIPKILYNNNIMNCNDKNDFVRALDIIKQELRSIGIIISFDEAKINSLEVNINIDLEFEFNEYANVLEYISSNCNFKGNRAKFDNNYNYDTTGFTIETKKYKLKFYNKSREQNIKGNILRVELTYKDADIINKNFNTTKLSYFIENIESVKENFRNFMCKYILQAISKKTTEQQKKVLKLARKIKESNPKGWVNTFISDLKSAKIDSAEINILDENEIWEVVKQLDKVNFARNKKNNLKHIPASWKSKNIEKLEEILYIFRAYNEEL